MLSEVFPPFSSVTQSCPTLCDPMDCGTPGFPVHHQLLELVQTHVHRVSEAIQPSHPVVPFSSCLQSFLASGSFQRSQLFSVDGQSTGVSAPASVLPINTQDWFLFGWTGWISLQSKGLSRVSCNTTKASFLWCSAFFMVQLSHPYITTGETIALITWTFVGKVTAFQYAV